MPCLCLPATLTALRATAVTAFPILSFASLVTAHYPSSLQLLLHWATSALRGTATPVPAQLCHGCKPGGLQLIQPSPHQLAELHDTHWTSPPPLFFALCIFPGHQVPFLRAVLAKAGHDDGHDAAGTSPLDSAAAVRADLSSSCLPQKVTADSSLVPGLIWLSKHI